MQWIVTRALQVYKFAVSPFLPSACRFYPTCSDYMHEAVERHAVWRAAIPFTPAAMIPSGKTSF
jgi:putative membrane protein insertion efficiency factor